MINFIYLIKSTLGFLAFYFIHPFYRKKLKFPDKVLFIHTAGIGDLIHSNKIINTLENDKVNEIYFLIKSIHKELYNNYNGRIKFLFIEYEKYSFNFFYKIRFLKKIRTFGFSKVFILNHHRRITDDDIALNSGADMIMALNISDTRYLKVGKKYFDKKYDIILYRESEYIQNKYNILLSRYFPLIKITESSIYLNEEKHLSILLNKYKSVFDKEYISINPVSSAEIRNWTISNFRKIIEYILNKYTYDIILLGEESQKDYLQKMVLDKVRVHNFSGKTNLLETFTILKKSKIFLGVDSALAHASIYFKIPRIILAGGGPFGLIFPSESYKNDIPDQRLVFKEMDCFGCNWNCKFDEPHCLNDINPNQVIEIIDSMLRSRVN